MKAFFIYLAFLNALAFLAAFLDKRKAVKGGWRLRERTLFLLAVFGGAPGLYAGLLSFRHKTKKIRFMAGVPLIFVLQLIAAWWLFFRAGLM